MTKQVQELDHVIIRFAGDSGDGMQLTGDRFTQETAVFGNDLSTLPNFPAEIRAPAGTLPGVSSFQLHFADHDILTPGDAPDVLVAMNPAALKANLKDLPLGAELILNTDEFTKRNLAKVGYDKNPLEDGTLDGYKLHPVPLTSLTVKALEDQSISRKDAERAKNMFALGLLSWLYGRRGRGHAELPRSQVRQEAGDLQGERDRLPVRLELRRDHRGLRGPLRGQACPDRPRPLPEHHRQPRTRLRPDRGGAARPSLPLFLGSYPITPASDILHELSKHKKFGVRTFQAEDEISAASAALGAAFGGSLAVTTTSGPGMLLKAETVNLAVSVELPLVVVDVQRAGPSTGMPTKTEQTDLLMALYGRNGESPVPVIAAASPSDCFFAAIEAARIAITYRTPVILLSDGYLGNGSEPWRIPDVSDLPDLSADFAFATPADKPADGSDFMPFTRDPQTLARPWAIPGTPGLEHRIGGIEKRDGAGTIDYDPDNHDLMVRTRAAKIEGIANFIPPLTVEDPSGRGAAARPWLGLHLRLDRRRGPPLPPRGPRCRAGAPAAHEPVPRQPRRGAAPVRQGARARDQPGAARAAAARQVPGRRDLLQPRPRPAVPCG